MLKMPEKVPEKGFYYHYKHDPILSINNYAYEVLGVGHHTEDDCKEIDMNLVIYRPLYEASVYKVGFYADIRPLSMFMENVKKNGKTFERFKKITDLKIISELSKIRDEMYKND